MSTQPQIDHDQDTFQPAGAVIGRAVERAGQSMVARREQDNEPAARNNDGMIAMIERVVMSPDIPLDRLEQMLAMKERLEDRERQQHREDREYEAKRAYFAAMSKCQIELPVVTKTRRNTHTNSNYADLAAIEEQAMPIIHKHGFAVSFQPDGYNDKGELRVLWEISHEQGHFRNGVGEIPVDGAGSQGKVNKTGTQAFGSTATYGRRYLLCMLFNISTGDDRDGNPSKEQDVIKISPEQVKTILALLEETSSDVEQFCRMGKVDAVPDILAKHYDDAVRILNDRKARMQQRRAS